MTTFMDANTASLLMVDFLQKYALAMTQQIEAVQKEMEESTCGVMMALQELSSSTENKKEEAEKVLEQTYFAPDTSTSAMVDSIQRSADDIFEQAASELANSAASVSQATTSTDDKGVDLRRVGGLFSKHMESMSTLDDSIKDIVMGMVGSMSNSDVVKQRLDHLIMSMRALHVGLSNILVDLDSRLNIATISDFKVKLLDYAYKTYTTEQEKDSFKEIFGAAPSVMKAYGETSRKAG